MHGTWLAPLMILAAASGGAAADVSDELFEKKVRPVLIERCLKCHGEQQQSGGLRLDTKEGAQRGGDSGPAIVAGKPDASRLIQAVRQSGDLKMPPKQKLTDEQIAAFSEWVRSGAVWPATPLKPAGDSANRHWAFQPVRASALPGVNSIDQFIQTKLATAGLTPNPPADRVTLIRRLTLDLHGLPPTPAEVKAFEQDEAADAVAKLVDRLLASPRYGERWGRHWLDVARYADTMGYFFEGERRYPFAYGYRDYVIRAFNDDKPYDRFILEQIAADRLPMDGDRSSLAALGLLTVGRRFLNNTPDIIDDRIDVVSRGLMGLTVSCARCHDHKYDPVPIQDYYSLYGVFASATEPGELPTIAPSPNAAAYEQELAKRDTELKEFVRTKNEQRAAVGRLGGILLGDSPLAVTALAALAVPVPPLPQDQMEKKAAPKDRDQIRKLTARLHEHRLFSPDSPPRAMVVNDLPQPVQPHVFLRGNPSNPGPVVPRQFLAVLQPDRRPFTDGSGRLDLAKAIADPRNPLTARVLVNRVWQHHFGQGLVTTPSDFGLRSDPPSHPELLDWLADRFVKDGWSIKKLHRTILLSATYQQSSTDRRDALARDPENRLLWKFRRQRLEFEALRDSMLATSGLLDLRMGGPSVDIVKEPFTFRRTVYGYVERQNLPGVFRTFDFASPDLHAPQRLTTTVPQQALFLMNSPFVAHVAKSLANRPEVAAATAPAERIAILYQLLFAREPRLSEVILGERFITGFPDADRATAWERYAQTLLLTNEFAFAE
ncbi:MAG: PSD1 and planctomycete cytochrome C domain-containing protein [Gemmataceae bacterium]|nr:PSD1 and planctomycete cytochrome C domain-containing protein [Gemmataceae bacterium]